MCESQTSTEQVRESVRSRAPKTVPKLPQTQLTPRSLARQPGVAPRRAWWFRVAFGLLYTVVGSCGSEGALCQNAVWGQKNSTVFGRRARKRPTPRAHPRAPATAHHPQGS